MKEQIISFDTAKLAKDKGFKNTTPHKLGRSYYNHLGKLNGDVIEYIKAFVNEKDTTHLNTIDAPTQSLLQKWLREEHDINCFVEFKPNIKKWDYCTYPMKLNGKEYVQLRQKQIQNSYNTYEEALEVGLVNALNLI